MRSENPDADIARHPSVWRHRIVEEFLCDLTLFQERASPTTSFPSVVLKKCRPDWDITTPEMRAAWKQGRKDLFYPYGKTFVQTLGEQD
jgi:hypothetical protein